MTPKVARALAAFVLAGCAVPNEPIGAASAPIVNGDPGGPAAVVAVQNYTLGGLCSGTLIGERVVLTAKHCVQEAFADGPVSPSAMTVGVGDNIRGLSTVLRVQAIHTTPGTYTEDSRGSVGSDLIGVDVALLVLQSGVPGIEPIPVRRDPPGPLAGHTITACGYGQTPSGEVGVKYNTMGRVTGVAGDLIYVGPLTCQGDSGGPAITEDDEVAGVVSFGAGSCGSGYGAYNAVYNYLDLIDAALTEAGSCLNNGAEVCDGGDNDCNGMVDENCAQLGEACTADRDCVGGVDCRDTVGGRLCTAPCDPLRPDFGCEPGFYCAFADGCSGWCVPLIDAGANKPNDADCTRDAECASLYCKDPGDGRQRCLSPCRGDAGMCLAGEACAAVPGQCNGCVAEDIVHGSRGLGEDCTADHDCGSGDCYADGARSYCTHACAADSECPSGYHCRGEVCAAGPRGEIGERCVPSEDDCVTGTFCVTRGDDHWCSRVCDDAMDACPDGFDCVSAGGTRVCAPSAGLVGDACSSDDACLSGLCMDRGGSLGGMCTRSCGPDAPCGVGFECRRGDDGAAVCMEPAVESTGGGCAVDGRSSGGVGLFVLAAIAIAWRRRRA